MEKKMVHRWDVCSDPDDWSCLVIMLGGSADSWTGRFLELVHKSDPEHLARLKLAFPREVLAWETWMSQADGKGAGILAAARAISISPEV